MILVPQIYLVPTIASDAYLGARNAHIIQLPDSICVCVCACVCIAVVLHRIIIVLCHNHHSKSLHHYYYYYILQIRNFVVGVIGM